MIKRFIFQETVFAVLFITILSVWHGSIDWVQAWVNSAREEQVLLLVVFLISHVIYTAVMWVINYDD